MWISTVFRRNRRSSRKRPAATSAGRSALVAEITRTSTRFVRDEPTRSISPDWSTRKSFACCWSGTLARSEEHTSELQSQFHLVCRLLLEKKKDLRVNEYS